MSEPTTFEEWWAANGESWSDPELAAAAYAAGVANQQAEIAELIDKANAVQIEFDAYREDARKGIADYERQLADARAETADIQREAQAKIDRLLERNLAADQEIERLNHELGTDITTIVCLPKTELAKLSAVVQAAREFSAAFWLLPSKIDYDEDSRLRVATHKAKVLEAALSALEEKPAGKESAG